jgi:hypothetical protein
MNQYIKDKVNSSITDRKRLHNRFLENCKTYEHFQELEEKAFPTGH